MRRLFPNFSLLSRPLFTSLYGVRIPRRFFSEQEPTVSEDWYDKIQKVYEEVYEPETMELKPPNNWKTWKPTIIPGEWLVFPPQPKVLSDPTTGWDINKQRVGLIGRKVTMETFHTEWFEAFPTTIIEILPSYVVQVKTREKDGYFALQVGTKLCNEKSLKKTLLAHQQKAGVPPLKKLFEFPVSEEAVVAAGTRLCAQHFVAGQLVDVRAVSKGKGFQGGMKRWGFRGQAASHGVSLTHRSIGSTGNRKTPARTFKGKKMAGHMGASTRFGRNLQILKIDRKFNLIYVKGNVPGPNGSFVRLYDCQKPSFPSPPPFPTYEVTAEEEESWADEHHNLQHLLDDHQPLEEHEGWVRDNHHPLHVRLGPTQRKVSFGHLQDDLSQLDFDADEEIPPPNDELYLRLLREISEEYFTLRRLEVAISPELIDRDSFPTILPNKLKKNFKSKTLKPEYIARFRPLFSPEQQQQYRKRHFELNRRLRAHKLYFPPSQHKNPMYSLQKLSEEERNMRSFLQGLVPENLLNHMVEEDRQYSTEEPAPLLPGYSYYSDEEDEIIDSSRLTFESPESLAANEEKSSAVRRRLLNIKPPSADDLLLRDLHSFKQERLSVFPSKTKPKSKTPPPTETTS